MLLHRPVEGARVAELGLRFGTLILCLLSFNRFDSATNYLRKPSANSLTPGSSSSVDHIPGSDMLSYLLRMTR